MFRHLPPAECSIIAFAEKWNDEVIATFCGFLNSHGGSLYFGVDTKGSAVGVAHAEELERQILFAFRGAIHPRAEPNVRTAIQTIDGKKIVLAKVLEGAAPPYYATVLQAGKSKRACFVREGPRTTQASEEEILALYQKACPVSYEERLSPEQSLTFKAFKLIFESQNRPLSTFNFRSLGLTDRKGFFTNLAFWLSDQCKAETRLIFFKDTHKASEVESILTLNGCLADQHQKIRELLQERSGFREETEGFPPEPRGFGKEGAKYPDRAVQEALLSMFANRDFSLTGAQALISIFSDHLEFLWFGGLSKGMTEEMACQGALVPRNPQLEEILRNLPGMEKFGIGFPAVFASYFGKNVKPVLSGTREYIKVELPKFNSSPEPLSDREKTILKVLKEKRAASRKELETVLNLSYGTTIGVINDLIERGLIQKLGGGRTALYALSHRGNSSQKKTAPVRSGSEGLTLS